MVLHYPRIVDYKKTNPIDAQTLQMAPSGLVAPTDWLARRSMLVIFKRSAGCDYFLGVIVCAMVDTMLLRSMNCKLKVQTPSRRHLAANLTIGWLCSFAKMSERVPTAKLGFSSFGMSVDGRSIK